MQAKLARAVVAQAIQAENVELKGDEMNVGCLIKSLFIGIFAAPIVWGILFIIAIGLRLLFDSSWLGLLIARWDSFFVISGLCYPLAVWLAYQTDKKDTTCPRCKMPFSWYEKLIRTETLSEDYISQDVKDDDGVYRRKAFRVGKERDYYRATCKECGFTTERTEVGSFKREVR